jgi:hypothetical protein
MEDEREEGDAKGVKRQPLHTRDSCPTTTTTTRLTFTASFSPNMLFLSLIFDNRSFMRRGTAASASLRSRSSSSLRWASMACTKPRPGATKNHTHVNEQQTQIPQSALASRKTGQL